MPRRGADTEPAPSLTDALLSRPYPGRGCLVGRTLDGHLCFLYFLTGRSSASRGRELRVTPAGDVAVRDKHAAGTPDELRHNLAAVVRG